jgi:hypothetical protein
LTLESGTLTADICPCQSIFNDIQQVLFLRPQFGTILAVLVHWRKVYS